MASSAPVGIDAAPAAGQLVEHDGVVYTTVKEGKAYILVPPKARTSVNPQAKAAAEDDTHLQSVFYNPIQQFNRDLSVLAIKAFGDDLCRRKTDKRNFVKEKARKKQDRKQKYSANTSLDANEETGISRKRKRDHSNGHQAEAEDREKPLEGESVTLEGPAPPIEAHIEEQDGKEQDTTESHSGVEVGQEGLNVLGQKIVAEATDTNTNSTGGAVADTSHGQRPQATWKPRFRILDALSATGLRALRYAHEITNATKIVANDLNRNAVKSIKANIEHNKLQSSIDTSVNDAMAHMYGVAFPPIDSHGPQHQSAKYDVIDLDPYGTAAPFIDAALLALEDGGLLCVTCTDSGVWASCGYSEKTYALYGGMPIKGPHSHEGGLRLILHSIASAAAKYSLAIEPLLSLSIDFYARVFVRVRRSPNEVKFLAGKTMAVYGCDAGCGAWNTQFIGRHQLHKNSDVNWKYSIAMAPSADRLCEHCGSKTHIAGPMWGGPIHNAAFIEKILSGLKDRDDDTYQTKPRIEGILDTALEELFVDDDHKSLNPVQHNDSPNSQDLIPRTLPEKIDHHPFYFVPSALCKVIKAQAPRDDQLRGALRHAGYKASRTHCKAGAIKTNAPWSEIWEIMREWVRQKAPVKEGSLKGGQAGYKIMQAMKSTEAEGLSSEAEVEEVVDTQQEVATAIENGASPKLPSIPLSRLKVVFDQELGKDQHPGKRLVRYQQNPRENWGPMARAKGSG